MIFATIHSESHRFNLYKVANSKRQTIEENKLVRRKIQLKWSCHFMSFLVTPWIILLVLDEGGVYMLAHTEKSDSPSKVIHSQRLRL